MARLIDADKLRKDILDLPNCYNGYSDTYDKATIVDMIDEQPSVDAHPLIRCKDCARNPKYTARTHCPCPMDRYMGDDGWCAFARRKEE